ncbi:carboxypeptidase regulatory-like domain-containing protein [Hymenobacter ruricola]|uniref:Carboxypeptidase regulatory-like domain-containing protein n=1 Tax=Hymenobacter ruricola TaxID=2791023 RepID=A0ABS0HZW4_9BACT|nr:carboxypeptidase regulatory-like domain-containing protein [Hymenobacter ruricola]MBF9220256.1 carboxypeptidase regulatory-like domain-containing protein [Hymenobacter ruricola]
MKDLNSVLRSLCLLLPLLLLAGGARAQASVQAVRVTVMPLPPYSTHLSDYVDQPNRLLITLSNTTRTPLSLQLAGTLSGDNGIRVQTKPSARSPRPVNLDPLQTRRLDQEELSQLFDENMLTYTGITMQQMVRGNGLPEGTYTICVKALDYANGRPLSAEDPVGCSRPFALRSLEPPYIIKPLADENFKAVSPQNILFTWSRPAGAPITTEYELRIVEMSDPRRNINDAFLAGTVPPLFERTVTGATVLLYGPSEPALIVGRRYAFAVTARDPRGQAVFRNNGRSEVQSFVYGAAPAVASTPAPHIQTVKDMHTVTTKIPMVLVRGNLQWGWRASEEANSLFTEVNSKGLDATGNALAALNDPSAGPTATAALGGALHTASTGGAGGAAGSYGANAGAGASPTGGYNGATATTGPLTAVTTSTTGGANAGMMSNTSVVSGGGTTTGFSVGGGSLAGGGQLGSQLGTGSNSSSASNPPIQLGVAPSMQLPGIIGKSRYPLAHQKIKLVYDYKPIAQGQMGWNDPTLNAERHKVMGIGTTDANGDFAISMLTAPIEGGGMPQFIDGNKTYQVSRLRVEISDAHFFEEPTGYELKPGKDGGYDLGQTLCLANSYRLKLEVVDKGGKPAPGVKVSVFRLPSWYNAHAYAKPEGQQPEEKRAQRLGADGGILITDVPVTKTALTRLFANNGGASDKYNLLITGEGYNNFATTLSAWPAGTSCKDGVVTITKKIELVGSPPLVRGRVLRKHDSSPVVGANIRLKRTTPGDGKIYTTQTDSKGAFSISTLGKTSVPMTLEVLTGPGVEKGWREDNIKLDKTGPQGIVTRDPISIDAVVHPVAGRVVSDEGPGVAQANLRWKSGGKPFEADGEGRFMTTHQAGADTLIIYKLGFQELRASVWVDGDGLTNPKTGKKNSGNYFVLGGTGAGSGAGAKAQKNVTNDLTKTFGKNSSLQVAGAAPFQLPGTGPIGNGALPASQGALPGGQSALPAGQGVFPGGQSVLPVGQGVLPAGQSAITAGQGAGTASQGAGTAGQGAVTASKSADTAGQGALPAGQGAGNSGAVAGIGLGIASASQYNGGSITDNNALLNYLQGAGGGSGVVGDGQDLGVFTLNKLVGRLRVTVLDSASGQPLAGATVAFPGTDPVLSQTTGADGQTYFEKAPGGPAGLRISGPAGAAIAYVPSLQDLTIATNGKVTELTVKLAPGTRVQGTVQADGAAVAGAKVRVIGRPDMEVQTAANGQYELIGVPKGPWTMEATKQGLIGQSQSQTFVPGQNATVNFALTNAGFAIDKLLGFPIEVKTLATGADTTLTGAFVNLPGNVLFSVKSGTRLEFANVAVRVDKNGVLRPKGKDFVLTDATELAMTAFKFLPVKIAETAGLKVQMQAGNPTKGLIAGAVEINYGTLGNNLGWAWNAGVKTYLSDAPGTGAVPVLPVLGSDGKLPYSATTLKLRAPAKSAALSLYGFTATVDLTQSTAGTDGLHLAGSVQLDKVPGLNSVKINVSNLWIATGGEIKTATLGLNPAVSVSVGGFGFTLTGGGLTEQGFKLSGAVKVQVPGSAASVVNFSDLLIGTSQLYGGNFVLPSAGLDVFSLAKFKPVAGSPLAFGTLPNGGPSFFSGGATTTLPLIDKTITVQAFTVRSDGQFSAQVPADFSIGFGGLASLKVKGVKFNTIGGVGIDVLSDVQLTLPLVKAEAGNLKYRPGKAPSLENVGLHVPIGVGELGGSVSFLNNGFAGALGLNLVSVMNVKADFKYQKVAGDIQFAANIQSNIPPVPVGPGLLLTSVGGGLSYGNKKLKSVTVSGVVSVAAFEAGLALNPIKVTVEAGPVITGTANLTVAEQKMANAKLLLDFPNSLASVQLTSNYTPLPGMSSSTVGGIVVVSGKQNDSYWVMSMGAKTSLLGLINANANILVGQNLNVNNHPELGDYTGFIDKAYLSNGTTVNGAHMQSNTSFGRHQNDAFSACFWEACGKIWYYNDAVSNLNMNFASNSYGLYISSGWGGGADLTVAGKSIGGADVGAAGALGGGYNPSQGWNLNGTVGAHLVGWLGDCSNACANKICWGGCFKACVFGCKVCPIPVGIKVCAHPGITVDYKSTSGMDVGLDI